MSNDKVNLFNPHDGLTGRDGGPYLDQEERRLAEIVRAAKEDREPDFETAGAVAGTPLVTADVLVGMANPASNPSMLTNVPAVAGMGLTAAAESDDFPVQVFSERDKTEPEKEADKLAESNDPQDNPASATYVSKDEDTSKGIKGQADQDSPSDDSDDSPFSSPSANTDETKSSSSSSNSTTKKTAAPAKKTASSTK